MAVVSAGKNSYQIRKGSVRLILEYDILLDKKGEPHIFYDFFFYKNNKDEPDAFARYNYQKDEIMAAGPDESSKELRDTLIEVSMMPGLPVILEIGLEKLLNCD